VAVISRGLKELGIIKSESDYKKYFMHGTSHYLGLDVHDAGTRGKLKPNSVITVEPGIYIPEGSDCDKKWWNIGVRIEDDILITETGWENLSAKAPRSTADIEKKMAETSPIFK
jgi:Xaa-Pro aminopeptidase